MLLGDEQIFEKWYVVEKGYVAGCIMKDLNDNQTLWFNCLPVRPIKELLEVLRHHDVKVGGSIHGLSPVDFD